MKGGMKGYIEMVRLGSVSVTENKVYLKPPNKCQCISVSMSGVG